MKRERKVLSLQSFEDIKGSGHGVPRDVNYPDKLRFNVGRQYWVYKQGTDEKLYVQCTQNCPYHLVVVKRAKPYRRKNIPTENLGS